MGTRFILAGLFAASIFVGHPVGAISVGPAGSAVETFDALPAAGHWSQARLPASGGGSGNITTAEQLDTRVQQLAASGITAALVSQPGDPPGENAQATWSSAGHYAQTRPSGCDYTVLMARLTNNSGTTINLLTFSYNFAQAAPVAEQIGGHRVYYSLNGSAQSWTVIPELCSRPTGQLRATVALAAAWQPGQPLYLLWADDNDSAPEDSGNQIDNFTAYPCELTSPWPPDGAVSGSTAPDLSVQVSNPAGNPMNVAFYVRQVPDDFTLVMLPDTQNYVQSTSGYMTNFTNQIEWIIDNAAASNIAFVAHLGDMVETHNSVAQWHNATSVMYRLELANVPYGAALGNHDRPDPNPANSTTFDTNFGAIHFPGRIYDPNDNDNYGVFFQQGNLQFMAIFLTCLTNVNLGIFTNATNWATAVLSTNQDKRAIIVTHSIINASGWNGAGQELYNAFRNIPNVFLMLCGHSDGERWMATGGNHPLSIVLADYQSYAFGGGGRLKTLRFSPASSRIYARQYNASTNGFVTGTAGNSFDIDYEMAPFTLLGWVPCDNNSRAAVNWPNLSPGTRYQWRVLVTNGPNVTIGPVWTFTTPYSIVNVDFAGGASSPKMGRAVAGLSGTDFWNSYSAPWSTLATVEDLRLTDGGVSAVSLTVQNAPGQWGNGHADPMYSSYVYQHDNQAMLLTLAGVSAGTYDLYLYGHGGVPEQNGIYEVVSGETNYGTQATTTTDAWAEPDWQEGVQYVVFRGMTVSDGQIAVTVHPGAVSTGGQRYAIVGGLQLVARAALIPSVQEPSLDPGSLLNVDLCAPEPPKVGPAYIGLPGDLWNNYAMPWLYIGTLSDLTLADSTPSTVDLTVYNAPGQWGNGHSDPMFNGYVYPWDGGNITLRLSLPTGRYDLYLYGHGPIDSSSSTFQVTSGSNSYGVQSTTTGPGWISETWQVGQQFVVFGDVQVTQPGHGVTVTVFPDSAGYAIISGLQVFVRPN